MQSIFFKPLLILALTVPFFHVNAAAQEQPGQLVKTLTGHTGDVWAVAYSPDGAYIASGGRDNVVKLWKGDTFEPVKNLEYHTMPVTSLAFAPGTKYLASASQDKTVVIWRMDTLAAAEQIKGFTKSVFSVSFSQNGRFMAAGSLDSSFQLLRNVTFKPMLVQKRPTEVIAVAFSHDGSLMATGEKSGEITIWSTSRLAAIKTLKEQDYISSLAFSADGKFLAAASRDKTVKVWSFPALELAATVSHPAPVLCVAFSPDSKFMATSSEDRTIKFWETGKFTSKDSYASRSNEDSIAFSPDGKYLVSAGEDKNVKVWYTPWEFAKNASAIQEKTQADTYKKNLDEGVQLMDEGFFSLSKAKEKFLLAQQAKDTPEIQAKLQEVNSERTSAIIKAGIIAGAVILLGLAAGFFVIRRKRNLKLKETIPAELKSVMQSGDFPQALKLYHKYRMVGGDMKNLTPEDVFEIFNASEQVDALASEKLPDNYFASFTKKLIAAGKAEQAMKMFEKFRAVHKADDFMPDTFAEAEVLNLYLANDKLDKVANEKISAATIISSAIAMHGQNRDEDAIKLLSGGKVLEKEGALVTENVAAIADIYAKTGKTDELVKIVVEGKYPHQVYSQTARAFAAANNHEKAITVLECGIKNYPKEMEASDYQLLAASYSTLGKLDAIKAELVPNEFKCHMAEAMMEKGRNSEALKILTQRPKAEWSDKDYHLCMQLYIRLDMYDLAEEMVTQMLKDKQISDAPEFYYDFAVYCEKTNKLEKAMEIYKEFILKGITFRDVVLRYPAVRDKLGKKDTQQEAAKETKEPVAQAAAQETSVAAAAASAPTSVVSAVMTPPPAVTADTASSAPSAAQAPVSARVTGGAGGGKPSRLEEDSERISRLKGGKMELIKEIGRGGMGIVYSVFDKSLNRKVAVKRMRDELYISKKEVHKFLNEARTVAQLNHPNIVVVYEIIEQDDMAYILFEYINGSTLEQLLENSPRGMRLNECMRIIEQICNGLSYAHNHNIIHRDLKPSNIMLGNDGLVKITDFGIARMAKDTILRLTGASAGTLAYMAPEQELGNFDAASDIYSLGVIFYEMLTGELPFRGPNFYLQKEKMSFRPLLDLVPELPKDIGNIITKCLQAEKDKRYASVDELLRDVVGRN